MTIHVSGRIGNRVAQIGVLSDFSASTPLDSLALSINMLIDLNFIEILTDYREIMVGLTLSDSSKLTEPLVPSIFDESLQSFNSIQQMREMETKKIHFLIRNSPLKIESVNINGNAKATIHKLLLNSHHTIWVILGFNSIGRIDSHRNVQLQSITELLAKSGFELLKQMCCLEKTCDPFNLNSKSSEASAESNEVTSQVRVSKSNRLLINAFDRLNSFEQSILELMAQGKSNPEIARTLFVSTSSIRNTSSTIYNKIGARNRQEAVVLYTVHQSLVP